MTKSRDIENKEGAGFPQPPSINLPKGGGAIRGMGEKFAANPVTGTGSMSLPIATSPGRSGFGPQLSLNYDSGAGNGPFGFGWNLSMPAISRKTDKGLPRYGDSEIPDTFILSGAEDLVPMPQTPAQTSGQQGLPSTRRVDHRNYRIRYFRPRIEGLFARIEYWSREGDPGDSFWRTISRDNITSWYGKTPESRIHDPSDPRRIYSWLICESHDDKGNAIAYRYKAEDSDGIDANAAHEVNRSDRKRSSNRYLKRILYANRVPYYPELSADQPWPSAPAAAPEEHPWLFEVVFDYGEHDLSQPMPNDGGEWGRRPDPFSSYRPGFELRTYRLCQRVLMFHHFPGEETGANCLLRSTEFGYAHEQNPEDPRSAVYSFLASVGQTGYRKLPDGTYESRSMPPLEFGYSQPEIGEKIETLDLDSQQNLPVGLDAKIYRWIDLDGTGLSGILTEQGEAWFHKHNLSPAREPGADGSETTVARLAPLRQVSSKPSLAALNRGRQQFVDLAGDGQLDLATFEEPVPGFYERTHERDWATFRNFESLPVLDWRDPNLKLIDLTGDGHADILISENEAFCWYPSSAESGFGPCLKVQKALDEESGPRVVFADGTQSIYLADLSGDGLSDIVRIRNGEICYWPHLGYGRFGPKVSMDNAPWFDHAGQFDQQRIRLADIDGSGTTDVIYLGRETIRVFYNESGNSWSAPHTISHFPRSDSLARVLALDLLGNGTACLVWSSPLSADSGRSLRYLRLMGAKKPHLLTEITNNLGALTRITYAPSTRFFLEDQQQGRPWICNIPFPVQVVERVETIDQIGNNRFSSHYAYHHGYFDGIEREFRGFGMVEQWDSEDYAYLRNNPEALEFDNIDNRTQMPPVHSKTWFHTGFYTPGDKISLQYLHEYYGAPARDDPDYAIKLAAFEKTLLADTILPSGLTTAEQREACRALRGSMLRQETYADDGTDKAMHPYSVTEQNFSLRRLQPRGENPHAVFFTHARESINYRYERNPQDPRSDHTMTLEVDDFGNVLREIAIGYGRRQPDADLAEDDQAKQAQTHIVYTENRFTNATQNEDEYRAPLPCETSSFHVTGLQTGQDALLFNYAYFTADNFAVLDGLSEIEYETSPDPGESQKRLIEKTCTRYRSNDLSALLQTGQLEYRALPGESYKLAFTPGLLQQVYQMPAYQAPDAESMAGGGYVDLHGDGRWWVPSGRIFFAHDESASPAAELEQARQHFYTANRFRDAFGFSRRLDFDYDLLIRESRDALENTSTVDNDFRVLRPWQLTDPNGNRTALAFDALGMVTATAVMGKRGETDPDKAGDTLDDPSMRMEYEMFAWYDHGRPNFVHSYVRERHGAANPRWQESYLYSDGFGRELQSKVQAEPGDAPQRGPASGSPWQPGELLRDADGQPLRANTGQRWVGSGRTVYNNKGKPVKQYEPFFSSTHLYEDEAELVETGVTPILFYDPPGRVVATLHPNQTYEKVVFDAWRQETWDVNDTVAVTRPWDAAQEAHVSAYFAALLDGDTGDYQSWLEQREQGQLGPHEQQAAAKALEHADTPGLSYLDSLGRPFLSIADNGLDQEGNRLRYATRIELDIEGNQRSVSDALERTVMRYDHDMLGNRIHQASMEAGRRWSLSDTAGKLLFEWDSREHQVEIRYDELRRPTETLVSGIEGYPADDQVLVEKTVYGEAQGSASNHRGQVYQQYDAGGIVTNAEYDFKGNLLAYRRQLTEQYKSVIDWLDPPALTETFSSQTRYDALNRPTQLVAPHSNRADAGINIIQPSYNEANLLERVHVWPNQQTLPAGLLDADSAMLNPVADIDYNARGQRSRIDYGNDVTTRYEYDPRTFRLRNLQTRRNGAGFQDNERIVQALSYAYDPVGNITHIQDDADIHNVIFFRNQRIEPSADYEYDPLYRLVKASGREHLGQTNGSLNPARQTSRDDSFRTNLDHPGEGNAMGNYTELYEYDAVGNILRMIHQAGSGGWTRHYAYESASQLDGSICNNRLSSSSLPGDDPQGPYGDEYGYDEHGNLNSVRHLTRMRWDYRDQLQLSSQQEVNNGGSEETTYYVYDAAGQRIRKITEGQAGPNRTPAKKHERIYLDGFEIYREFGNGAEEPALERETLHLMDDQQRIGLLETRSIGSGDSPGQLVRYQLSNHLGSASLELDDRANVISYEEYYPYGASSYRAMDKAIKAAAKRYRYSGKERDDETGFYYYGARYYAAWLGRWISVDQADNSIFKNRYSYAANNPVVLLDNDGFQEETGFLSKFRTTWKRWFMAIRITMELWAPVVRPFLHKVDIPPPVEQPAERVSQGRKLATRQQQAAKMKHPAPKVPATTGIETPPGMERPSHAESAYRDPALKGSEFSVEERMRAEARTNPKAAEKLKKLRALRQKLPPGPKPGSGRAPMSTRTMFGIGEKAGITAPKGLPAVRPTLTQRIVSTSFSKVFAVGSMAAEAAPIFLMGFSPYWCEAAGSGCGWLGEASIEMERIRKKQEHETLRKNWEETWVKEVGPEVYGQIHAMHELQRLELQEIDLSVQPDPYPVSIEPAPRWERRF